MNQKLRLALDFGPLLAFFFAYRLGGIQAATLILIAATLLSLAVTYRLERRLALMPLLSGVIITCMGTLTLLLHDDTFIKIKPTLINLLFAGVLLGGVACGKSTLKYVLSDALHLSEAGWKKLSLRWGVFFLFLAALNEAVWRNSSLDFWVNFKVFGMFTLTLLFSLAQIPLIKRCWVEPANGS